MKRFSASFSALLLCGTLAAQDQAPLELSKTISFPQVSGGFNHHSADGKLHRVFVCATTNKTVEVIDLNTGKVVYKTRP